MESLEESHQIYKLVIYKLGDGLSQPQPLTLHYPAASFKRNINIKQPHCTHECG